MSNSTTNIVDEEKESVSMNLDQLVCQLKDALFDKYISNYLIKKGDKIWNIYQRRLDRIAVQNRLPMRCDEIRPQTLIRLEEMLVEREDEISKTRQNIENLCSKRKRQRDETMKKPIESQSSRPRVNVSSSTGVPKTPRCIDRSEIKSNMKLQNDDEFERENISRQETTLPNNRIRSDFRHCRFEHGEILSNQSNKSSRIVRIRYSC